MPTMRWRAESAQFSKRDTQRQKATTTWLILRWFHPSGLPPLSVGADDPFNLANVRSFKARGNHRLWNSWRGSRRGTGEGRGSHGVGSRRRVNDDTLHVCQVGGNGSGSALNIDEGALCCCCCRGCFCCCCCCG